MKIPCSIVRELLPNYIDDCMEDDAKMLVEEHLKECDACRALYENMKKPLQDEHKDKELDYTKESEKTEFFENHYRNIDYNLYIYDRNINKNLVNWKLYE